MLHSSSRRPFFEGVRGAPLLQPAKPDQEVWRREILTCAECRGEHFREGRNHVVLREARMELSIPKGPTGFREAAASYPMLPSAGSTAVRMNRSMPGAGTGLCLRVLLVYGVFV